MLKKSFKYLIIATVNLTSGLLLSGCDCVQKASGVVLDAETRQPLDSVALGKFEKEDAEW